MTGRDYALTTGLQTANPFYRDDFGQTGGWEGWTESLHARFGGIQAALTLAEMGGTSAVFYGINRFTMPRITGALNRIGVRGFWLPLFLSSTTISIITSGLMVMVRGGGQSTSRLASSADASAVTLMDSSADEPSRSNAARFHRPLNLMGSPTAPGNADLQAGQRPSLLGQWLIGIIYSLPSTMLGMGGAQIFKNISQSILFDFGTEPIQAIASTLIGNGLEATGVQQKSGLTTGERFIQEFTEGLLYFGVGRAVGGGIRGFTEAYEPPKEPFTWISGEKVGQVGRWGFDDWLEGSRFTRDEAIPNERVVEVHIVDDADVLPATGQPFRIAPDTDAPPEPARPLKILVERPAAEPLVEPTVDVVPPPIPDLLRDRPLVAPPKRRLSGNEKAAAALVRILKANRKRGLTQNHVPYASEVDLRVVRMRAGKEEGFGVTDGDTLEVVAEGLKESVPLRLILVNSVEAAKGSGHPEVRNAKGELGALEAYWFLLDLSEMHGRLIRARLLRSDAYLRPVVHAFARIKPDSYLDINSAIIESGNGHVYCITPDVTGKRNRFLRLQLQAQQQGLGMWGYPHYRRGLHITGYRTFTNDPEAHPHIDFVRICNLSPTQAYSLDGMKVRNGKMTATLPDLLLQPGEIVKVFFCGDEHNDNVNRELAITARDGRRQSRHPLLDSSYPIELLEAGSEGKIVSVHIPGSEANQKVAPEFRHEREEGVHVMALNPLQHVSGFRDVKENVRLYNHGNTEVDVSDWKLKNGKKEMVLPPGTVIPPYRAIQVFTCTGKSHFDPAGHLRLYLKETRVDEPIWDNNLPMILLDPTGKEISMEAATPAARKLVPLRFWRRKGMVS